MLTFNVMVKGSAVHRISAKSKAIASNKASRWIESVTGSHNVAFKLQADRLSAATSSSTTKRSRKVDATVTQITV